MWCINCKRPWLESIKIGYGATPVAQIKHKVECPDYVQSLGGVETREREPVKTTPWAQSTACKCLHPPTHSADCPGKNGVVLDPYDYVGPKILESYWLQLDECVDSLLDESLPKTSAAMMRGRAEAYAWCIAKLINQAEPNMKSVRDESMRRRAARLAEEE